MLTTIPTKAPCFIHMSKNFVVLLLLLPENDWLFTSWLHLLENFPSDPVRINFSCLGIPNYNLMFHCQVNNGDRLDPLPIDPSYYKPYPPRWHGLIPSIGIANIVTLSWGEKLWNHNKCDIGQYFWWIMWQMCVVHPQHMTVNLTLFLFLQYIQWNHCSIVFTHHLPSPQLFLQGLVRIWKGTTARKKSTTADLATLDDVHFFSTGHSGSYYCTHVCSPHPATIPAGLFVHKTRQCDIML